jgi:hypothetical protein
MRIGKNSWRHLKIITFLPLICFSLNFWACKPKSPVLIALGEARIIGAINAGVVTFQAGENAQGNYYIVGKAMITTIYKLAYQVKVQGLEIKRLEAELRKK